MTSVLVFLASMALSGPAEARVHVVFHRPAMRVVIDPWAPDYQPAPRSGYSWVSGFHDAYGYWHPGYWVPVATRPGLVWVAGHWEGPMWVEGYWRPPSRAGVVWVDGYYHQGAWVKGDWHDPHTAELHRARSAAYSRDRREDHLDRVEDRRDRAEDIRDRREDAHDIHPGDREDYHDHREDQADRHEDEADRREDREDKTRSSPTRR